MTDRTAELDGTGSDNANARGDRRVIIAPVNDIHALREALTVVLGSLGKLQGQVLDEAGSTWLDHALTAARAAADIARGLREDDD